MSSCPANSLLCLYKRLERWCPAPTVLATIMLVCCQISLLLALGLPALSLQNILPPHQRSSMEDNSPDEELLSYNAAPYSRYLAKRDQLEIPNMDNYNFNERFTYKLDIM